MRKAIFFDRDGVINRLCRRSTGWDSPQNCAEWEWMPHVLDGARRLAVLGYELIVATNQPSIRYGTMRPEDLAAIHTMMQASFAAAGAPLREIAVCFHGRDDGCRCRKPQPGMICDVAQRYNIDLASSYVVGDRDRDVEAGQRAGCRTVWIPGHYPEPNAPDLTCRDILVFAEQLEKGRPQ